jgi:hypothetical protein
MKLLFACILGLFSATLLVAQNPTKPVVKIVPKFKPPVVKSSIGRATGTAFKVGVEEAKIIIAQSLIISDANNNKYMVASYQFAYKRVGVTEDEATGKVIPAKDMVARQFSSTPLPQIWIDNITEGLRKDEELHFFDIIVKDSQGRRFFAPELQLIIQ